jgi:hypothetical protein
VTAPRKISAAQLARIVRSRRWWPGLRRAELAELVGSSPSDRGFVGPLMVAYRAGRLDFCGDWVVLTAAQVPGRTARASGPSCPIECARVRWLGSRRIRPAGHKVMLASFGYSATARACIPSPFWTNWLPAVYSRAEWAARPLLRMIKP